MRRKPPAKRLFNGSAGSALATIDESVQAQRSEPVVLLESGEPSSPSPKTLKFPSMRQTLMLGTEDLIALFDESPATKIGERVVFEETDFLLPTAMLEHRIERLKKIIACSKATIEGLSVQIMKIRRGKDEVLDKPTREKYKREETHGSHDAMRSCSNTGRHFAWATIRRKFGAHKPRRCTSVTLWKTTWCSRLLWASGTMRTT